MAVEFESYIHGALFLPLRAIVSISCWVQDPLTENVQNTQEAFVLKELLHRWKSVSDSTEDRAVADCDISNNTVAILTQVRQQQGSLEALLASNRASFHVGAIGAGSRSDDGPGWCHFQVTVRLSRCRTQGR